LILEKNGSFTYTILEEIGYENINKLTIITTDALCADIIKYIIGKEITEKEKLLNIKYIKNINEMENMGQFDVVVGNPPYQSPYKTSTFAEQIYPQFVEMGNKIGKTNVQIFPFRGFIQARLKDFKDNIFNFGVKELYIYNEHYVRGTMFQDVTIRSGLCVLVSEKDNFKTVVHSFDRNGKEQIFKDVDLRYNSNILKYREHVNVISKIKTSATFEDYFEGRFASTSSPYFSKDKTADSVKIFVSKNKSKSRFLYIRKKYLKPKQRAVLYKYRAILLSIASNLQSMFKIDQNEIFSNSYSGFVFNSQKERDNFINLCNRKLMIYKFNLEKPFYNLNSKELFKNIPILSLDKTWTDQEIYDHFKLTKEDIKLIESETAITTEDAENIKSEAI
jgi:site-specific DNA-methyltransferase (adenine-specific)